MAMNLGAVRDDTMAEMNTTPLIDVMLVLLTLLIITLPLQTNAVKIDLPHGTSTPEKPVVVDLGVEFDGTITWDGVAVSRADLDARLADAAKKNPQPEIHLRADHLAKYDTVAKVLSDAQRLGMKRMGFTDTRVDGTDR
jgi:biopolymer transport protein ExbD